MWRTSHLWQARPRGRSERRTAREPHLGAVRHGDALDVKNVHVVNVEFYTGVDERLDMPVLLPPVPKPVDLSGASVLIATTSRTPARR